MQTSYDHENACRVYIITMIKATITVIITIIVFFLHRILDSLQKGSSVIGITSKQSPLFKNSLEGLFHNEKCSIFIALKMGHTAAYITTFRQVLINRH